MVSVARGGGVRDEMMIRREEEDESKASCSEGRWAGLRSVESERKASLQ